MLDTKFNLSKEKRPKQLNTTPRKTKWRTATETTLFLHIKIQPLQRKKNKTSLHYTKQQLAHPYQSLKIKHGQKSHYLYQAAVSSHIRSLISIYNPAARIRWCYSNLLGSPVHPASTSKYNRCDISKSKPWMNATKTLRLCNLWCKRKGNRAP